MSHPLKAKITSLRARTRRLVTLHGLSRVLALVTAVVLPLGLADYLIRFQDRGLRLIASGAVIAVIVWACYRYLYLPLRAHWRDVDLARRIQRRFPALGDRLASAVEFLDQSEDDATAGSVALRRAVISRATAETDQLDFQAAIEPKPTRRAAGIAVALGLIAVVLGLLDPPSSGIALARLANPFGNTTWPQTTHLVPRHRLSASGEADFTRADHVAKGRLFEVEVIDRYGARLPSEILIHYRFEDSEGDTTEETQSMHRIDAAAVARRENVTGPFFYRMEGGDDHSMPWIPVEVLEPPAMASLALTLTPPRYTGWPREHATGHVRALAGTRIEIAATATKPLTSTALCFEDGRRVPGVVSPGARDFRVPGKSSESPELDKSGGYWLELVDTEGLTVGEQTRWEIRVIPDAPPTVLVERPTATVFVTPEAVVPVRMVVKDDLALHAIGLEFERSDRPQEPPTVVALDEGPPEVEPLEVKLPKPKPSGDPWNGDESGQSRTMLHDWQLAPLGLTPGTSLTLRGTATDYRPQTGTSEPRRVMVITPEELAERLASRQAFIISELTRVLEMQRASRQQVATLEIQLETLHRLDQLDVDHLRGAEMTQRQVAHALASSSEGVPMHVQGLLDDLENNKIDGPDVRRRMEQLLAELERLQHDHLPIVARDLTASIKAATIRLQDATGQRQEPPREELPELDLSTSVPLTAAGREQDRVIASLEQILDQLARWDGFRRFHRDLGQLIREQEALAGRSAELARRTLTRDLKVLPPRDTADLKIAALEQLDLARLFDRLQQAMQTAIGQLEPSDPLAAETLSDALYRAAELGIAGSLRDAGGHLGRNRMGQATETQRRAIEDLREVLDILANRREHELVRLIRKLRQAETDLADLAQKQHELEKQIDQAAAEPDEAERRRQLESLEAKQKELQDQAERIERRLERLQAQAVADTVGQATQKMEGAGQCAGQGEGSGACREAKEAGEQLDKAQQQLTEKIEQAELELAGEQLAQLKDTLKAVHLRQQKATEETARLDRFKQAQGDLSDAQTATLGQLAREQHVLADEVGIVREGLAAAEVFRLALSNILDQMTQAADLLDRSRTDEPTRAFQRRALAKIDQLIEALQPEEPEEEDEDAPKSAGGQGGPSQCSPGQALQAMAEIKLLKLMQEEINTRTRALEEKFDPNGKLSDEAQQEYLELSQDQGRLADLLLNLMPSEPPPESLPDGLPDGP